MVPAEHRNYGDDLPTQHCWYKDCYTSETVIGSQGSSYNLFAAERVCCRSLSKLVPFGRSEAHSRRKWIHR